MTLSSSCAIEVGIWRIDNDRVEPVASSSLEREFRLEDVLERDLTILGLDALLIVGRQVITRYGKRIDLLALDVEGSIHVIELKKDRTPREIVAQVLDEQRSRSTRPGARPQATWNGQDFYYSVGEDDRRSWDDMVRFGFISAGGGRWYSNTLKQLEQGHRVFACIPQTGYVGVGVVTQTVQPVSEFTVAVDGKTTPILDAGLTTPSTGQASDDPDRREYLVRVR